MAHDPPQGELGGGAKARSSDASSGEDSPPGPVRPAWRRLWSKVHTRFARQIALVAVAIGTIAAVGHFLGGMIGWWEAYRITLGEHKDERAFPTAKSPAARTDVQSLVVLPLIDESEKRDGDWFIDMLTSDLTAELSRMPSTLVISRDTARTFKGKAADPRGIGGIQWWQFPSVRIRLLPARTIKTPALNENPPFVAG